MGDRTAREQRVIDEYNRDERMLAGQRTDRDNRFAELEAETKRLTQIGARGIQSTMMPDERVKYALKLDATWAAVFAIAGIVILLVGTMFPFVPELMWIGGGLVILGVGIVFRGI